MSSPRHVRRLTWAALLVLALCACSEADSPHRTPDAAEATEGPGRAPALVVVDPQFPDAPLELDLGRIDYGDVLTRSVQLRNTTDAPLTIRSVRPGCSCTQPRLSYVDPDTGATVVGNTRGPGDALTLPPGVTAALEFRVDSTTAPTRNKPKLVLVRLVTDSPLTPFLTLSVRLFVVSHFRPAPAVIDLREVAEHGGAAGEVALAQDGEEARVVTGVARSPLELVPELRLDTSQGIDLWVLRVRLLPPVPLGFHEHEVELETSGPGGVGRGDPLVVKVRVIGVPDARIEPPVVLLSRADGTGLAEGTAQLVARLEGQLLGGLRGRFDGAEPSQLALELSAVRPDGQGRAAAWDLRLRALTDLGDEARGGTLWIETDDPQYPRFEARWFYRP